MGFFDLNWQDPNTQAALGTLAGLASGFGKAAMPSTLPIGTGAALGMAADGAYQGGVGGAKAAQAYQGGQLENTGKAVGVDQALIIENVLRKAMGMPPLTAQQMQGAGASSPLFGTFQPPQKPAVTPPSISGAGAAPGTGADGAASNQPGGPASDGSAMGTALVQKLLGFAPTDYGKAKLYASMLRPGSPERAEAERAAAHSAGINMTPDVRQGGVVTIWNPSKKNDDGTVGGYDIAFKNPQLPEGTTLNDQGEAVEVPGAMPLIGKVASVKEGAKAQYQPLETYDQAGNEYIVPRTALVNGAPAQPGASAPGGGYAQRVAQIESGGNAGAENGASSAEGAHQFLNQTWLEQAKKYLPANITQGRTDQQLLALRKDPQVSSFVTNAYARENAGALQASGVQNIGAPELYMAHHFGPQGAATILKAPANTPLTKILPPAVIAANPDLKDATVADVYSHARQEMKGVQFNAPSVTPQQQPAPAAGQPNTPVQNSAIGIPTKLEDFLSKLGPNYQVPGRPMAPAGALLGEPSKGTEEIQKLDADRLEQYSKEAAGGQKVYTNLQQLYQIMGRGLSTGNMTNAASNLANYAQQIGAARLVPKNFDPNDAAAFNKLATDLVFAQLKQIGGRPMVSEIEGLKQANPNTGLPVAANVEILNNILADQRWRDSRADLARQYMARFGSLGDFDARFNEMYPEVDAYNRIADKAAASGWKMPGGKDTPSGRDKKGPDPAVQAKITPKAIAATAKKYGKTEDYVKQQMRAAGYKVP
ncbi:hypothetical protein [uncultured Devosia sp.]|uniref:hypothetical protein n=1 Tax=uncultured Devosia sp. TaxID=211434 RepID=UPI0026285FC4|nr:hypothetical protein [uncultured Devosia sp.]